MKFVSAATVWVAAILCVAAACLADDIEIKFDDGGTDKTTVIGLFTNNGLSYHERVDFTLHSIGQISSPRVLLHVHVGSDIRPAAGSEDISLGVRVNGKEWRWQSLEAYRNDKNHWIEFPISSAELEAGLNTVEVSSTVANVGNMTSQSVDMLSSGSSRLYERSYYSHDLRSYTLQHDRNWGIRLRYDLAARSAEPVTVLKLAPDKTFTYLGSPVQFIIAVQDSAGNKAYPGKVEWSVSRGWIDEYGLYHPTSSGCSIITAKAGGLVKTAMCDVKMKIPAGVEGPTSSKRLKPYVPEGSVSLNGNWKFRTDPQNQGESQKWYSTDDHTEWSDIHVPGSWQAQGYGLNYHGIGWYQREFEISDDWQGRQVRLHFDAVATHAKVWVNGQFVGEHTGNWSPFDLNITDALRPKAPNIVVVRVEELPSHTSAGFPMVVAMHYGGIWQPVSMYTTGSLHIEDVFVLPHLAAKTADVEVSISGKGNGRLTCRIIAPDGSEAASVDKDLTADDSDKPVKLSLKIPDPAPWSPESPKLYKAEVEVRSDGKVSHSRSVRFGMRDIAVQGSLVMLNGEPIYPRGVLHWGYYPYLISIDPSEQRIRQEFNELRAAGFNLVKVCLFMMPRRFYEIADEMGMLVWQEYPTWQSFPQKGSNGPNEGLAREFTEWFRFDRNHPSVIIRDLTCESHNPDPAFMERIFKLAKSMTGCPLIADNSAYLNQIVTDFYDCHLYREVDTMYADLPGIVVPFLRSKAPDIKPYLTGEDLDCDTYRDTKAIRKHWVKSNEMPWWLDHINFRVQESTEKDLCAVYGNGLPAEMVRRQNIRALAVRKALIEEFRRYPELSGYVMTHISDITLTTPGFYDDLGRPKWKPEQWKRFTDDRVLLINSSRRSRCFRMDEKAEVSIELSNFGESLVDAPLKWKLVLDGKTIAQGRSLVNAKAGEIVKAVEVKLAVGGKLGNSPVQCLLQAEIGKVRNEWPVWFFPAVENSAPRDIIVTDKMDETARKVLRRGGTVVFLPKDDDAVLPRRDAPFWREMAIWLPSGHPALGDFPHKEFVDLQFLNMTQRRPFDLTEFRSEVTPLIWGVNARFGGLMLVDYLFEAKVGRGKLIACCLKLGEKDNSAGQYLLKCITDYAASDAFDPETALKDGKLAALLK